ncbi:hypothetical protein JTE90_009347 [Oedothorax gibbosus]|uniref:Tyrosine-protein kinase ephrin type A/B receptor-like domain-containing protein n=1 Tax=Oedothorax gibbosus TaxID=931172 RepID=A0AAV6VS75_9ARAC|nr:hypothetical protein JTE90_009347 [Oedothorax gibbosus]
MNISTIIIAWTLIFHLQKCFSSRVELNVEEKSGSKVKLICMPPNSMLVKTNDSKDILSKDSKFGTSEKKKVILNDPDLLVVSNSSEKAVRLKCLFKALKLRKNLGARALNHSKARKERKLAGSESKNKSGILKEKISREEPQTAGYIQTEEGNCPPGHRIDQDRCFPCFPGSYTSGQETECFLCPKDFYMSREGADSCWPCPDGKGTLKEGADSESACIGVHKKSGFSLKWIILIILLTVFLLLLWICISHILIRMYLRRATIKYERQRHEEIELQDLFKIPTNKNYEQKSRVSRGKSKCKKHHGSMPHFRKQWKVDFEGSAILTDNYSSSNEEEDTIDIQPRNKSTCEIPGTDTIETQLQVKNSNSVLLNMPETSNETSNEKIGNSNYVTPIDISSQIQPETSQVKVGHHEKVFSENDKFLTSINSSTENTNESQEYQTCQSFSCISDDVLFNRRNITKPTSCPLHREIVNRCHVEVVLIPYPSLCS